MKFLKPKEVSNILNISLDCVYKLIKSNKLKANNFSSGGKNAFRILEDDLQAFLLCSKAQVEQRADIKISNFNKKHNTTKKIYVNNKENLLKKLEAI